METRRRLSADGKPLHEVVAGRIRADIIGGHFEPGDRLTEERLASRYSVSRNPIREAIRRLESEGFVEALPNRGATVSQLSAQRASELLQVRSALETLVVSLAASRRDDSHIEQLRDVLAEGHRAVAGGSYDELADLNSRFHALLADASANLTLTTIIAQLRDKIAWVYVSELDARAEDSWAEHAAMLEAIEASDPERAVALMADHIANAEAAYVVRHQ